MKRIALIRNSYSFDVGGAEIFPISLAKILTRSGYETIVMSSNIKTLGLAKIEKLQTVHSPWWSFQNFSGAKTLLFPAYVMWMIILTLWYLVFFLKNRIDVAHPQSRDDFIAATVAAKLLRRKVIWTDHADLKYIYMNNRTWYKNPVGKLVFLASKLADQVTVESRSEMRLIKEALGTTLPANYRVIHIGVVDSYKLNARKDGKLVFVSTSRLVTSKGIGELIEGFKLLDDKNTVLKLCGDGPEATHFKSLAAGINNIEFLGHVNDVVQVLQNSDVLVHPSYHEGFGLSLVEAEMCCLPIIACDVGSIPEIVEDGLSGILVPPKNAKALAEAMSVMVSNPGLRAKMGRAGREMYLENFQFDKIVKKRFLPLYE